MARHQTQGLQGGHFFCTFTCWRWLSLIEETALYDHLYAWMHLIREKGCLITGFVFMPNHVHLLIFVPAGSSVNTILSNMKRFAAYEVLKRLKEAKAEPLLKRLAGGTRITENERGNFHKVWGLSSDIKPCYTIPFILQKLNYIHQNPVRGKWKLVANHLDYAHSSAAFYENGAASQAPLVHYAEVHSVSSAAGGDTEH